MMQDICLSAGVWHNLYTAVGVAVGTEMLVYQKTGAVAYFWEGVNQPDADSRIGIPLTDVSPPQQVDEGSIGCWVWSAVPICLNVQV